MCDVINNKSITHSSVDQRKVNRVHFIPAALIHTSRLILEVKDGNAIVFIAEMESPVQGLSLTVQR
jgi:hypothetical protein